MTLRRGHVVLALLVGGVVALAGSSRPWVESFAGASGDTPTNVATQAVVTGSQAAPVVTAAALVALAAAGAVALSGRVTRFVALVLALLAGLSVLVPTVQVLSGVEEVAAEGLAESSGVVGGLDVREIEATTTAWPAVVIAAGVLVLLASLAGLARARRWDAVTRFETPAATAVEQGPGDDWDALTRDEDPTQHPADDRPGSHHPPG